jgi:uncharacterized damage-inducible protein DinB
MTRAGGSQGQAPTPSLPEPTGPPLPLREIFLGYLDFFRSRVITKIEALPEHHRRTSVVRSGWTPLELLKHLTYVEMRWLEWGFEGAAVVDPWGDERHGRWYVGPDEAAAELVAALRQQGVRTAALVRHHQLDEKGQPGPRWAGAEPATLERVLFHLVQEYARHLGQLDVSVELIGGPTGE